MADFVEYQNTDEEERALLSEITDKQKSRDSDQNEYITVGERRMPEWHPRRRKAVHSP